MYLEKIYSTKKLRAILDQSIKDGLAVHIEDSDMLEQWQLPTKQAMTLRDVWSLMIERVSTELDHETQVALEHILRHGNLSERILRACRNDFSKEQLMRVYRKMGDCLVNNQQFQHP